MGVHRDLQCAGDTRGAERERGGVGTAQGESSGAALWPSGHKGVLVRHSRGISGAHRPPCRPTDPCPGAPPGSEQIQPPAHPRPPWTHTAYACPQAVFRVAGKAHFLCYLYYWIPTLIP